MDRTDPRPPILKLGIALLAVNDILVLGLCALGGVLGSLAIVLGGLERDDPSDGRIALVALLGAVAAFVLVVVAGFAVLSLGVCAMAWRGSRPWVAGLVGVALLNCIVVLPNPLAIVAAVLCILGGLEFLENDASHGKIDADRSPPRTSPGPAGPPPDEGRTP
jgi:hypothetical protein